MKKLLVALTLIATSCAMQHPYNRLAENVFRIQTNVSTSGMGTVIECDKQSCYGITVAHVCNPHAVAVQLYQHAKETGLTAEQFAQRVQRVNEIAKTGSMCSGQIQLMNQETALPPIAYQPVYVDFKRDLMVIRIDASGMDKNIIKFLGRDVQPSEELVLFTSPLEDYFAIIQYGKAGLEVTLSIDNDDTSYRYLQTDFNAGPGASGSPVYVDGKLAGIYAAQIVKGANFSPIRASMLITGKMVSDIYDLAMLIVRSGKDLPGCVAGVYEDQCKVLHGEVPFYTLLRDIMK